MFKLKGCLFLLVILLIVSGCSSQSELTSQSAQGLKVSLDIPEELGAKVSSLTIEEYLTINRAEVRLYHEQHFVLHKTVNNPVQNNEFVLADLAANKEYQVKVELWGSIRGETQQRLLYKGQGSSGKLKTDTLDALEIGLEALRAKSLEISEVIINNSQEEVKEIALKQSSDNKSVKEYTPGVIFLAEEDDLDLIPARWELIVELSDGTRKESEILLLPAEEKKKSINFNLPSKPSNLDLDINGNLTWDQDTEADSYLIYRAKKDEPDNLLRPVAEIGTNIYRDVEEDYYYWVSSYNRTYDYQSQLSNSYHVDELRRQVLKYRFSSGDDKSIDLGKIDSAIVAITPLNIDASRGTAVDIYDATLGVNFGDGSTADQVIISEQINSQGESQLTPQAEVDAEMRRLGDKYLQMDLKTAKEARAEVYQQDIYYLEQLGATRTFYNRHNDSISATLKAISEHALVYVADAQKDKVKTSDLEEMAERFADTIYPSVTDNFAFHSPSEYDWDGNGKTIIFIYDMGGSSAGFTAGYFHGKDYWDDSAVSTQRSNEADMFYMNSFALDLANDSRYSYSIEDILSTLAHEFQHLLFYVNKHKSGRSGEDVWINEGFSQLAEYLTGYYEHDSDRRISEHYFPDSDGTSLMGWEQELKDYGVTSLFALYIYERFGVEIIEAIHTSDKFTEEIISGLGHDFADVLLAWAISNYIDDLGLENYSYQGTNLSDKPEISVIDGSISDDFSVKSTALKYFKINGNGSDVNLEIEGLNEETGVVIYWK